MLVSEKKGYCVLTRKSGFAALAVAAAISLASPTAAYTATAAADAAPAAGTMMFLNGTDPIPLFPVPVQSQQWMGALLRGAYADDVRVNVDYPASVWPLTFDRPTMGQSVRVGIDNTAALVRQTAGAITVVGISQGALVADGVAGALAGDGSLLGRLTIVSIADPNRPTGLFTLLPAGTYIPILNLRTTPPPDSPYDTTVIVTQYDGVANFPDRPWNVISDLNAVMGFFYYHLPPTFYLHVGIPTSGGVSVTNPLGGTTTTYLIPSPHLPLTQPLRDLGIPAHCVDVLDQALRPVIDAGFSQLTPGAGPHISYGRLVRSTGNKPAAATPAAPRATVTPRSVGAASLGAMPRSQHTAHRADGHR